MKNVRFVMERYPDEEWESIDIYVDGKPARRISNHSLSAADLLEVLAEEQIAIVEMSVAELDN